MLKTLTGLDILINNKFKDIKEDKVSLVINHTALSSRLEHILDIIGKKVVTVFTPEHGLMGDIAEGRKYSSYFDKEFNVMVYSLYGNDREPPAELLKECDAIIYDIQDAGVRWYTYESTLYYTIKGASKVKIPVYVLDRPNPINGVKVEGPILESSYRSFVGISEIPIRHGLTIGELASFFNLNYNFNADLRIIRMKNWSRKYWFNDTGLPWVPPSPNMPSVDTAIVYPGFGLIEGTNLSEGRGTTKPFEFIGAPWIKPRELAKRLNSLKIPGVLFRPIYFRPWTSKYAGKRCGGVQVHIIDREIFKPISVALTLIKYAFEFYKEFEWRKINDKYWFDILIGNSKVREMIERGEEIEDIEKYWMEPLLNFYSKREKYLLYLRS